MSTRTVAKRVTKRTPTRKKPVPRMTKVSNLKTTSKPVKRKTPVKKSPEPIEKDVVEDEFEEEEVQEMNGHVEEEEPEEEEEVQEVDTKVCVTEGPSENLLKELDECVRKLLIMKPSCKVVGQKGTINSVVAGIRRVAKRLPTLAEQKKPKVDRKSDTSKTIDKPHRITKALADFLDVDEDTRLSRLDITRAINTYIRCKKDEDRERFKRWNYLNPNGRNLRNSENQRIIEIEKDEKLCTLLNYKQYVADVKAGKITKKVKNPETGKREVVKETDYRYTYPTTQRLIKQLMITDAEE